MRRHGATLAALLALSGCTLQPGTGFATLQRATLEVALDPGPARDLGDGGLLTDLAYEVRFDALTIEVGEVALQTLSGGGGTFDPASPPPGYSLCHGGHCHADDGRLVPYAEIEAELAGESASFVPLATMPVDRAVDALAAEPIRLDRVEPSRDLPLGTLRRVALSASRIEATGAVTAGPDPGGLGALSVPLAVDLPFEGALTGPFDLTIDRSAPAELRLDVRLALPGTLLDGMDLATLATDGRISLDDPDTEGATALLSALADVEPTVTIEP